jgi:hypothetical protein
MCRGSFSNLYADDLVTCFIYNKKGGLENQINKYLKEMEGWPFKWRMKISAQKCYYNVFSKDNKFYDSMTFNLKLSGGVIP